MNDSEFDDFLRNHSRSEAQPEAAFRRGVWQRIETQGAVATWQERLIGLLVQPMRPFAGALCMIVMLLAGIILGSLSNGQPGHSLDAKASYLVSITPTSHNH